MPERLHFWSSGRRSRNARSVARPPLPVHQGSEHWRKSVHLPSWWTSPRMGTNCVQECASTNAQRSSMIEALRGRRIVVPETPRAWRDCSCLVARPRALCGRMSPSAPQADWHILRRFPSARYPKLGEVPTIASHADAAGERELSRQAVAAGRVRSERRARSNPRWLAGVS